MLLYKDVLTGDELLSDSYGPKEIEDGFFLEVDGKWITKGEENFDIGANPSAEEAEEGVDAGERKVVDIIDAFRLQEMPAMTKKDFMGYVKPWLGKVLEHLPAGKKDEFKAKSQAGIKFILGKLSDLQFFVGESMDPDGTMCYAIYKEGASSPTFYFPAYALKEEKL